tara:strand:+ start:5023 stop:6033 length:1011 start_codon:yes stop_codon:yes gene_type:complete
MTDAIYSNDRAFGIEIEFVGVSRHEAANAIRDKGVVCHVEHYNHETRDYWKVVTDASLREEDGWAGEVVSPILQGVEGIQQLKKVCEGLQECGARINVSCGVHVHLDVRDLSTEQVASIFSRYTAYQSQIDSIMPRSRRESRWCRSQTSSMVEQVKTCSSKVDLAQSFGRYYKVNMTNVSGRGAIEFRQHSGTIEFQKIYNWLKFLQQFTSRSIKLNNTAVRPSLQNRAFSHARKLIEDSGYQIKHRRYRDDWSILSAEGELVTVLTSETLRHFYPEALTPRERRVKLLSDIEAFKDTMEVLGVNISATSQNDAGWLDGVDEETQEYLADRAAQVA